MTHDTVLSLHSGAIPLAMCGSSYLIATSETYVSEFMFETVRFWAHIQSVPK